MKTEPEYFKIREGIATYLCRKTKEGCEILAQLGKSGRWIKFRKPQYWKWFKYDEELIDDPKAAYLSRPPLNETVPIAKEEVAAILLMGENEREL
jgi:hypothetical protein